MEIIIECILNPGVPCDSLLNYTYILWFLLGVVLIVLEFFIPGVFIVFFGIGGLVASVFQYLFNFSIPMQVTTWIVSSFAVLLFGAKFLKDLFPSEESYEPTMKESVSGRMALVIKNVHVERKGGRISFQGTDWDAVSLDAEIPKGNYAKIVDRENLTFKIQTATEEEIQNYLNSIKKIEEED